MSTDPTVHPEETRTREINYRGARVRVAGPLALVESLRGPFVSYGAEMVSADRGGGVPTVSVRQVRGTPEGPEWDSLRPDSAARLSSGAAATVRAWRHPKAGQHEDHALGHSGPGSQSSYLSLWAVPYGTDNRDPPPLPRSQPSRQRKEAMPKNRASHTKSLKPPKSLPQAHKKARRRTKRPFINMLAAITILATAAVPVAQADYIRDSSSCTRNDKDHWRQNHYNADNTTPVRNGPGSEYSANLGLSPVGLRNA
ncbi:hypothetical protein [Streptomyces sp. NPDC056672]|uniref:hypothetical protein n=1 Tax=Streptomyces sp. NPDC056672 TaxID=3345906 RepID=UPI0036881C09